MFVILSKEQLIERGINASDVRRQLKKTENRCNFYQRKFVAAGFRCDEAMQKAWDQECARWDHLKATLRAISQ